MEQYFLLISMTGPVKSSELKKTHSADSQPLTLLKLINLKTLVNNITVAIFWWKFNPSF